jgi:hypothetical protein
VGENEGLLDEWMQITAAQKKLLLPTTSATPHAGAGGLFGDDDADADADANDDDATQTSAARTSESMRMVGSASPPTHDLASLDAGTIIAIQPQTAPPPPYHPVTSSQRGNHIADAVVPSAFTSTTTIPTATASTATIGSNDRMPLLRGASIQSGVACHVNDTKDTQCTGCGCKTRRFCEPDCCEGLHFEYCYKVWGCLFAAPLWITLPCVLGWDLCYCQWFRWHACCVGKERHKELTEKRKLDCGWNTWDSVYANACFICWHQHGLYARD